ncbi:MAG: hypothetical protein KBT82_17525 [Marinobacter sp.]|uniref:hypothetical protein n=1 Tax=Marinobacter sp. TaxID=50741 RepID=UPI001B55FEAE|nr:hypothetical protein [Marinobacter sp.]MBQ0747883.1 hypothetical protein [Marinobacter sp.]MBQ0815947.1 hypothetical protein [Marinobacter sp.]
MQETFFRNTEEGRGICQRHAKIRETCLVDSLASLGIAREDIHRIARALCAVPGLCDQASRTAASL